MPSDVGHQLQTSHQHQKKINDRKVHGKPYKAEDLVWLYHPAVPQGQEVLSPMDWTIQNVGKNYQTQTIGSRK